MARLARVIAPGLPHHVTQRGNRRQQTFFCDEDYQSYIHLMSEWCGAHEVEIWAYCLMPNHVHLIAVPHLEDGLRHAVGEVHRRYTRMVNFREGWRGHLWQGRFASFVLDEPYLLKATRYIELNPVRAGLISAPSRYPWSSAAAHVRGRDDTLVSQHSGAAFPRLGQPPDHLVDVESRGLLADGKLFERVDPASEHGRCRVDQKGTACLPIGIPGRIGPRSNGSARRL